MTINLLQQIALTSYINKKKNLNSLFFLNALAGFVCDS